MEVKNFLKILMMATVFYYSTAHHRRSNLNDIDFSNNVIVEETFQETGNSARFSRLVESIFEQNNIPESSKPYNIPFEIIERTSRALIIDGFDPFYLNDLEFQVSSKSIKGVRYNNVLLDAGKLFGMSDFRCIDDPKAYKDQLQMYLIWNRLRASYTVTVNKDGLKNVGKIDIRIGRLTMHVQLPKSSSKPAKIEMSQANVVETKTNGLDMFSEDFTTNICLKTVSKIKNFVNGKIRSVLLNYVQTSINDDSVDNELSPLMMPREYDDEIL